MNAEQLSLVTGMVLSIGLQIIPGLKDWFDKLTADLKRLIIVALLAVVAAAIFGLSCLNVIHEVACTSAGAWLMFEYFALAAVANQVTYKLIRRA